VNKEVGVKTIAANELKTRGVSSIEQALAENSEAIISVRGQDRYVIMDMEEYNRLRVCELEAALYETRQQVASGEFIEESVNEHIARLRDAAK
jgi:translation elongation factor P/translation initiation factor 5A